jgi:FkbM family methyltransferase
VNLFVALYRKFFCSTAWYSFNVRVFDLCLRGIGVLNYEGYTLTGEAWFQNQFLKKQRIRTIIDVGANSDPYGLELPGIEVFALEPHTQTFHRLVKNTKQYSHIHCFPIGLSNKNGSATLYDLPGKGSAHASLAKTTIEKFHQVKALKIKIKLQTLDTFVRQEKIKHIDLLKIDTEGNEYNVLLGAKKTLAQNKIKYILFEFNEMNVYGKVFLKDFYELLEKKYAFYRLLPDGLGPLGPYRPITHELFAFQNIVAIRK